ncbi:MAG TPA: hypothetical protein VM075_02310, partial [Anaerolineae bacterium]|nr:hypothetical protein [Anaerolineae bacterium]
MTTYLAFIDKCWRLRGEQWVEMGAESEVQALLRQGIAAARGGRPEAARDLLSQVLDMDPENERAWLWMSGVVPDEERIVCLENVLAINPSNELARIGLESLLEKSAGIDEEETIIPEPERRGSELPSEPELDTQAAAD